MRVVFISMQNAAHMKEHHADGSHSIHHDVEAKGDSAFLLAISWPSTEELAAMKHCGYSA